MPGKPSKIKASVIVSQRLTQLFEQSLARFIPSAASTFNPETLINKINRINLHQLHQLKGATEEFIRLMEVDGVYAVDIRLTVDS